ncbi:MAG: hypothetical protein FLDDKLPJ_02218 [Phycisphaerae bacterium]|nr:hypothetical protein [Phycisphaerae bacterium]
MQTGKRTLPYGRGSVLKQRPNHSGDRVNQGWGSIGARRLLSSVRLGFAAIVTCASCAGPRGGAEYRFLAGDGGDEERFLTGAAREEADRSANARGVRPAWPGPPDEPRVFYLGEFRGSEDVGARTGNWFERVVFGEASVFALVTPQSVAVGSGWAAVADPNAGVHRFNPRGDYELLRGFVEPDPGRRREDSAGGDVAPSTPVAVAGGGAVLFVADAAAGCVFVVQDGEETRELGRGALSRPAGLAYCEARGVVRVADAGAHEVVVFDRAGALVGRVGRRGAGAGEFNYPSHVASAADGRWAVSDSLNFRVQVFDADDRFLMQIGGKGNAAGNLALPKGVAFDADGNLWVVDAQFENVQAFDREGRLLMAFGQEGHGPGEFWLPSGMCIDAKNRMWVADTYNRRVQVFQILAEARTDHSS